MATVIIKDSAVRKVSFEYEFCSGQATVFIFSSAVELDIGYTLTVYDELNNVAKTLTVGNGITLDTSVANIWKMEIDFGNDLLDKDYTFDIVPDNKVAPFDVKYNGKLISA